MNKVVFMLVFLSCAFASVAMARVQDKPVALFVVNDAGAAIVADQLVGDQLEAWGFDVLWMSAAEVVAEDADGAAIVVISSSTLSTQVGDKFTAAEAGVLTWEGGLYDDLFLCSAPAWGASMMNTNLLTIVDPGHPLAGGLSGDVVVVTESPQEYTIIKQDSLIASAAQIATMVDDIGDKHTVIVGFEKGAVLYDGSTAAGRRCGFFLRDNTATVLTDEGWQLFKAAVMWTAAMEDTDVEMRKNNTPQSSRLLANYPNPFNPRTTIPFVLDKQGDVSINVYDVTGRHIKTLASKTFPIGHHQVDWHGVNELNHTVSSGIYFVKMRTLDSEFVKKILLTK